MQQHLLLLLMFLAKYCVFVSLYRHLVRIVGFTDFHISFILSNSYFSEMYTCDKSTFTVLLPNCLHSGSICDLYSNVCMCLLLCGFYLCACFVSHFLPFEYTFLCIRKLRSSGASCFRLCHVLCVEWYALS